MPNFEKYSVGPDFTKEGKQINIGEIKELKDGRIEVEILAGCDINAALETM